MNNTDNTAVKERKRTTVTVIVEREFIGEKPFAEVLLPVLFDDMRRKAEKIRTFDNRRDTA